LRGAALIVFTSGSTGTPKGVVLGHQQLAGKLEVLARLIQLCPADTVILPLQLTFIYGIWVSLLTISSGARLVLLGKFTASELAAKLRDGGSVMAVVPSMLRGLLASEPQPAAPRLKSLICGGEMLTHRLGRALLAAFPHTGIFDLYGLTETGSCDFCLPPAQFAAGLGSIGGPTEKVHYRIVDANAAPVDPGAAGELLLKTPFGMLGYLDDPGVTAGSYRGGFFCTGDQAKLRPDGRLQIVGRLKDMISRGGNKIAPAEIDTLLASHPEVSGALCAGVPDARLGEVIHAVVTLHPQSRLTPHTLLCWAAGQIEKFKLPDVIHIREALPTGPSGKLDRAAIVRLALAEGEAPPT
jgi:acyl-CoA synthetase (AMP-forming)/AMP-acid ligase II